MVTFVVTLEGQDETRYEIEIESSEQFAAEDAQEALALALDVDPKGLVIKSVRTGRIEWSDKDEPDGTAEDFLL